MQIDSRVDGNYSIYYQNNSKVQKNTKNIQTENENFVKEDISFEDSRQVCQPWMSMGAKVRENLAEQTILGEEEKNVVHKKIEEMQDEFCKNEDDVVNERALEMIFSESTSCSFPASDTNKEDIRYITCYTEEGIFCKKAGLTDEYEWTIPFENKDQYDKVMKFIEQFSSNWNLRFAAHENFWQDFLNDEIDVDGFMEFMDGTSNGEYNYTMNEGTSDYIDMDNVKWAKYMNPLDARVYTEEEIQELINKEVENNQYKKKSLYEMITDACLEGAKATFRFEGESKIYDIYEYIDEIEKRLGKYQ